MIDQTRTLNPLDLICTRLAERTATLFLGAGVNGGIVNDKGEHFPLGAALSEWIARDLLGNPELRAPLDYVADMAIFKLGVNEVNRYIYERFATFRPGTAHLSLAQLPWDVIYTTNYDLLVEQAFNLPSITPAGKIRTIVSSLADLTPYSEEDILYYKLHGSIDVANTPQGKLVLTKEDYRHYQTHRRILFHRLERDLLSRSFVFIGYSLSDTNFIEILDTCRAELGVDTFPLSFAIWRHADMSQEAYWKEKYNIQLIATGADEFLNELKEKWISGGYSVNPFEERGPNQYLRFDQTTRFRRVAESYYRIRPADCTGASNPGAFFRGAEPTWGDIRDKVPPHRDAYWTLFEAIFPELYQPTHPPGLHLVTGSAGTGKTTLIRGLAYDLAKDFDSVVIEHIPSTPLDTKFLTQLVDTGNPKRIVLIVRFAAERIIAIERFMEEAKQASLPITVILEERKNQWTYAIRETNSRLTPTEIELGSLSEQEISNILDALEKHGALGRLTNLSRDYQLQHFRTLAQHDLLVALRELTSEQRFDDIVRDEYQKIPSEVAKEVYKYVAALGQIEVAVRYEILIRLLGLRWDQLGPQIFQPTAGILISGEDIGQSRFTAGYRIRARHPIVAAIVFAMVAPDDDSKFKILNDLLSQLDPGFPEDYRVLEAMTLKKELVRTLASLEKKRAIYDRLETKLPGDPFVLQHRSILERELEAPDRAIYYAREAMKINPNNESILNTLGMALEFAARSCDDPLQRQAFLSEATILFDDGIRRDKASAYSYFGKFLILKQQMYREQGKERKAVLRAEALSLLDEAYEVTNGEDVIATALAEQRQAIGDIDEAIAIAKTTLQNNPSNSRLRDTWISFEIQKGRLKEALKLALAGVQVDPTAWRLYRHVARLQRQLGEAPESVLQHYDAALRHNRGDVNLMVEYGAYLFENNKVSEANKVFSQTRNVSISYGEKQRIREWWRDKNGNPIVFSGRVKSILGTSGTVIAIPQNFEAFFPAYIPALRYLRVENPVQFRVGFNAYGASARILTK